MLSDEAHAFIAYLTRVKRDMELTFNTPHGRRTLGYLAKFGHLEKTTMVDGVASTELEGRRQMILKIKEILRISYDDIAEMVREEEER